MGPLDLFAPDSPGSVGRPAKPRQRPAPVAAPAALAPAPVAAVPAPEPAPVPAPLSALSVPVASPLAPAPVPPVDGDGGPAAARDAQLDAVPIGLPALLNELVAAGALSPAGRRRLMDHFRLSRGRLPDRERAALGRLAAEVGRPALHRAARAAAARRLGIPLPVFAAAASAA